MPNDISGPCLFWISSEAVCWQNSYLTDELCELAKAYEENTFNQMSLVDMHSHDIIIFFVLFFLELMFNYYF